MRRLAVPVVVIVTIVALFLAVNLNIGLNIPTEPNDFTNCEAQEIKLAELETGKNPGCDLAGSWIAVPEGFNLPIPEVGGVVGSGAVTIAPDKNIDYTVTNWGVSGVAVTETSASEFKLRASTKEALRLEKLDACYKYDIFITCSLRKWAHNVTTERNNKAMTNNH